MMKEKNIEFIIKEKSILLPFLFDNIGGKSRTTVKSYLTHRQVLVNNTITTRHSMVLKPGDKVTVKSGRGPNEFKHPMVRLVYEDDSIIVIDKKNGLLSMGTDKERLKTAFYIMSEHVKKSDPAACVFILHRLDRETSGLMMLARNEEVQSSMQRNWKQAVRSRKYVAVVEGKVREQEGAVDANLAQNKNLKVYVCGPQEGEEAVTKFKVLKQTDDYTLLELELETGKKNQIRAHMEHIGHPIVGDKKYGAKTSTAGRVCLHAKELDIIHPVTGVNLDFSTPIPSVFTNLLKKRGMV